MTSWGTRRRLNCPFLIGSLQIQKCSAYRGTISLNSYKVYIFKEKRISLINQYEVFVDECKISGDIEA